MEQLLNIQLETTSRCRLFCKTCLKPVCRKDWLEVDMSRQLFEKIVCQLPEKCIIHLQGWGDPLCHPDLVCQIKYLRERSHPVTFTTCGSRLSHATAVRLIEAGVNGVTFSFAGITAETQDKLRGKGSFENALQSLNDFLDVKQKLASEVKTAISYLLTPETIVELPKAVLLARRLGVDALSGVHLTQVGGIVQRNLQLMVKELSSKKYQNIYRKAHLAALFSKLKLILPPLSKMLTPVCDKNPLQSLFITSRGEVSPCVFLAPPLSQDNNTVSWMRNEQIFQQPVTIMGDLTRTSLPEIWENRGYKKFREIYRKRLTYHDQLLSRVSYSLAGSKQLEYSVEKIKQYFRQNPPPEMCRGCYKVDGY